jgi:hypothetical protein
MKGWKDLLQFYRERIHANWEETHQLSALGISGIEPANLYGSLDGARPASPSALKDCQHVLWMLDEMDKMDLPHDFPDPSYLADLEKFHRWLGFVQGVLWGHGIFDLDELREQTRQVTHAAV